MKVFKKVWIVVLSVILVAVTGIFALWHNEIATIASITTIIDQDLSHDDGYTYEMNVSGEYYFDDFLKQGGVSSDEELIQFITVQNMDTSMPVHCQEGNVTGTVDIGRIMKTAQRANAEALASEQRMSCHIALPAVTPRTMGGLFYFFMLTVAYEGGLAGINAFDQPGVETYKKIMHSYLKGYMSGK